MRRTLFCTVTALSFAALPFMVGCEDTVSKHSETKQTSDGTTIKKEEKVTRNPDYWKPGRPYLDAIEYTLMPNPATSILAFGAGKFDRTGQGIMSIPLMKQLKDQAPNAECTVVPWNIPRQMLVNRSKPPFDNAELRRAMALTLDRRAFIDILSDGQGEIARADPRLVESDQGADREGVEIA